MSLSALSFARKTYQSPPRMEGAEAATKPAVGSDITEQARAQEKDGFRWGKVAAGLGLAVTALSACTNQVPPAADAGAYEIESPEIVVLSDSTERIDISREQERTCTGSGDTESCRSENVSYHQIGIHVGEGVVQDLNGNLFAAPQLSAKGTPGVNIANPDRVEAKGPFGTTGTLSRQDEKTFQTRGWLFGNSNIEVTDSSIVVGGKTLFGGYESMRVTTTDGVATISEGRRTEAVVQSQGDHVLVQTKNGHTLAEIRHEEGSGQYKVSKPALFGGIENTASYNDNTILMSQGRWSGNAISQTVNDRGEKVIKVKSGPFTAITTTVQENGWLDNHVGPGSVTYTYQGGKVLPQN